MIFNLYPGEWPTYYSLPMWPGLPQLKSIIDLNGIIGSPSKIKNILEICSTWISEIWRETSAELIKKSFIICGVHNNHLRDSNNNIQIRSDNLHSTLKTMFSDKIIMHSIDDDIELAEADAVMGNNDLDVFERGSG